MVLFLTGSLGSMERRLSLRIIAFSRGEVSGVDPTRAIRIGSPDTERNSISLLYLSYLFFN